MLCSYMSHWWEHGPESNQDKADSCCTSVTSEHMNTLLGNILKIIYNNLGIDEGAWMKRLAGKTIDILIFYMYDQVCDIDYIHTAAILLV